MGCPGDWQPDCEQAQLTLDAEGPDLEGHVHACRPGSYEYKVAIDRRWDENYGAGGARRRQHRLHRPRRHR